MGRDGMLRVDVTDSGNGIAPEHLPHIFNPFWQAEQPATRRAGGAGLGLSIARRLARLINGDVVASSTPEGTTFRFERAPSASPARPGPGDRNPRPDRWIWSGVASILMLPRPTT
jgi:two-component system, OmpR family, sensor histidine kinase BaeS